MFKTNFLQAGQAELLAQQHGTPLFVYSEPVLRAQARALLAVPAPYGFTARYAMKANPHPKVLAVFRELGVLIDASSAYEVERALQAGYRPEQILLTSQQLAHNLKDIVEQGVQFNATSLHQLQSYGELYPGKSVSIRMNPGIGSGHSAKTDVGGVTSGFGIWHEYIPLVQELCQRYQLTVDRLHTHIGAGTDPAVWHDAALLSLDLIKSFPDATIINLGGGFKVGRMDDEPSTDIASVGVAIAEELKSFRQATGRELHLELEPGTFLVANAGVLLASIDDIVDTGTDGHSFIKLNTGLNDILRPSLYGAQHPIAVSNNATQQAEYVVIGHNCESGDLLTPAPGNPEILAPRLLNKATIGDLVLIGGTGAYCASMAAHGYNSYPSAKEIMIGPGTA